GPRARNCPVECRRRTMSMLRATAGSTTRQSAPSFRCWSWCRCRRVAVVYRSNSRTRTYRQMARPQFLDVRDFVQIAQTKMIEKKFRGFVKQRTSGNFGATGNFNEAAFHQRLQNPVDGHAADGFDIR